jgi:PAS domain S-box-containing protein
MSRAIQVLVVEDQVEDALLTVYELRRGGFEPVWRRVETEADYIAWLDKPLDVILADYSLPSFDAPRALQLLRDRDLDIPFIVVTGTVREEAVIEVMKSGAVDYLLKDRMARLGQAVSRALEDKRLRNEKRLAETALRDNEARIRRLTENAQDIIYRFRLVPSSALEYINSAITTVTGFTPEECYKTPGLLFSMLYEEDEPLLEQLLDPDSDLTRAVTMRWVHKDGSLIWIEQRNVLLKGDTGQVIAIEGIARDITERKRLETELLNAELLRVELEKEKELTNLKDRFTAMVSHEFRTPLTVILASGELLERHSDQLGPEKRLRYLRQIQSQVHYMVSLLDDVLVLGKARAGKIQFDPVTMDIEAFCRNLLEQQELTHGTGYHFVFTNESSLTHVLLDEQLIRHIFVNLLSNAVKYSPKGGEIRFELSRRDAELVFRVSDQGIGIPTADQDHLFEPFHRAQNTKNIEGTGLGLAIVKHSVEAHGGSISVESQEGSGTRFIICLPISDQS